MAKTDPGPESESVPSILVPGSGPIRGPRRRIKATDNGVQGEKEKSPDEEIKEVPGPESVPGPGPEESAASSEIHVKPGPSPKKRKKPGPKKATAADSAAGDLAAMTLLGLIDGFAVVNIGDEAGLTDEERESIRGPLGRVLARYVKTAESISMYADPLAVVFMMFMYYRRIAPLIKSRSTEAQEESPGVVPDNSGALPSAPPLGV